MLTQSPIYKQKPSRLGCTTLPPQVQEHHEQQRTVQTVVMHSKHLAQVAIDAGWACGKEVDDDVRLDAAGMRQAIAWELALRNVKRLEAAEAEVLLRRETQCEAVRDVKVRPVRRLRGAGLCAPCSRAAGSCAGRSRLC